MPLEGTAILYIYGLQSREFNIIMLRNWDKITFTYALFICLKKLLLYYIKTGRREIKKHIAYES